MNLHKVQNILICAEKPHNPMLNGGAIMSCALILNNIEPRSSLADKYDFLFNNLHKLGGRKGG